MAEISLKFGISDGAYGLTGDPLAIKKIHDSYPKELFKRIIILEKNINFLHLNRFEMHMLLAVLMDKGYQIDFSIGHSEVLYLETMNQLGSFKLLDSLFKMEKDKWLQIRPHQFEALKSFCEGNTFRSGIILMPCGSGKTLVGVCAASLMRRATMVVCTTVEQVHQWNKTLHTWLNLKEEHVCKLAATEKFTTYNIVDAPVVITTYKKISNLIERVMKKKDGGFNEQILLRRQFALMILDEVHTLPAKSYRKIVSGITAFVKIGLTATLIREDEGIEDVKFLVGPILHKCKIKELVQMKIIPQVRSICVSVNHPNSFIDMISQSSYQIKEHLSVLNPFKFIITKSLVTHYENLGSKVMVFCEKVKHGEIYATALNLNFVHGTHPHRQKIIEQFKAQSSGTIIISKIGDIGLDIPDLNVIIQLSGHHGSRMQEMQRFGRLQRNCATLIEKTAVYYDVHTKLLDDKYRNHRLNFIKEEGIEMEEKTFTKTLKELGVLKILPWKDEIKQKVLRLPMILQTQMDSQDVNDEIVKELSFILDHCPEVKFQKVKVQ